MTIVERCPKCGKKGSLHLTRTRGYHYWRIAHYTGYDGKVTGTRHVKWCYIGKELPEELKRLIE
jgi:hypothetical protein